MPELPTMSVLDNHEKMQELDPQNVLGSLQALARQVEDAWDTVQKQDYQLDTSRLQNIVVAGMGGSALGPDVIKHAFADRLSLPLEIINDYQLPAYVNENSLVVASSYSGNTEETVAAAQEAKKRQSQVLVVTTGGQLLDLALENNFQYYQINPQHNPSGQPRMALGYSIFGIMALLQKVGLLPLTSQEVNQTIATIRRTSDLMDVFVPAEKNQAKKLAFDILNRIPVFVVSEHLQGAGHILQNQFNENGKTYAEYRVIPELNHHLMEGLRFPQTNDQNLFFVLFESELYHSRTQKRFEITQQIIDGADIDQVAFKVLATTALEQVFEVITLGAFANYYLAILNGVDPAIIETVDFFKQELNK